MTTIHSTKTKRRNEAKSAQPWLRRQMGNEPARVEQQVWYGPLDNTLIVLRTRPRKPDEQANNDHAIEIYIKIEKGKGWTETLSTEYGWEMEGAYCMKVRDTWIDPDSPNAQKLMEILAKAMTIYLEEKTSQLDERTNPIPFLIKANEALTAMENHLLANERELVEAPFAAQRLFDECGRNH